MNRDIFAFFLTGIIAGIIFIAAILTAMEMETKVFSTMTFTTTDLATLIAGFGGTILGGGISWLLARQTASDTRKRDEEARNAQDKASLLQTILKVMQVSNGLYTIHRNIEGSAESANEQGIGDPELWTLVRPVAGRTETPKFDASDFVPFAVSSRPDLINRIIMISNRYDAIESALRVYSERRLSFQDLAGQYTTLSPSGMHVTVFPADIAPQAGMRAFELEQLIKEIRENVNSDLEVGKSLCADVDKFAKDYLRGKGGFVSLGLDEVNRLKN